MTIPVYTTGALALLLQTWLSDKMQKRALFLIISAIPVTIGYLICVGTGSHGAGYAAMFILSAGMFVDTTLPLVSSNTIHRSLHVLRSLCHLGSNELNSGSQALCRSAILLLHRQSVRLDLISALPNERWSKICQRKCHLCRAGSSCNPFRHCCMVRSQETQCGKGQDDCGWRNHEWQRRR
jgi:hypothetical protein